jgi:DNA polymerase sigma
MTQCDSKSKNGYSSYNYNEIDDNNYDEEEEDNYFSKKEEESNNNENNNNIGFFLFKLLKFYSKEFDYEHLGFSINRSNFGNTFFKVERTDMDCSETICAESIQDQGIDVGRSCYNYQKIINLFKETYDTIKAEKQKNTLSILQSLGFPSI